MRGVGRLDSESLSVRNSGQVIHKHSIVLAASHQIPAPYGVDIKVYPLVVYAFARVPRDNARSVAKIPAQNVVVLAGPGKDEIAVGGEFYLRHAGGVALKFAADFVAFAVVHTCRSVVRACRQKIVIAG